MPAVLNEQTQFLDSSGTPIVGGKAYFGVQNADPVTSPQNIFSDRALTSALSNPQILDANGRTTNKVWIGGRFSLRIDTSADVQVYQELDNGEDADTGVTSLENVSGADTITATAVGTTITAYVDLEQYTFRTVSANTAAITLNIDTVGAKSVVKNKDAPLVPNDFESGQNVIVQYNSTNDNFEWVNQNVKTVQFSEGSAVVAAATTDIWDQLGNNLHVTGNTGITSFGTAPNVGAVRWLTIDGTPTFTNSANLALPGGIDFTAAAGDVLRVQADTTTQHDVQIFKKNGTAAVAINQVVQRVSTQTGAVATGTTTIPVDDTIPQNTEGDEYMTLAVTPANSSNILEIKAVLNVAASASDIDIMAALFQDSIAGGLAVGFVHANQGGDGSQITVVHTMTAGTTSPTTFKIRVGPGSAATITFNGSAAARLFGGVMASSIIITETSV